MKSYNTQALRGEEGYDDHQFKQDMIDTHGMVIPDYLLYKPEMNDYVLNEIYKQSCRELQTVENPKTSANYTEQEAQAHASELRSAAKKNINRLGG